MSSLGVRRWDMSELKFMEGCDTRRASWERSKRFLESYRHKISRYYALLNVNMFFDVL
jgi:hypothetical protein